MSLESRITGYLAKDVWTAQYEDFTPNKKYLFDKVIKDCANSFGMEIPGD